MTVMEETKEIGKEAKDLEDLEELDHEAYWDIVALLIDEVEGGMPCVETSSEVFVHRHAADEDWFPVQVAISDEGSEDGTSEEIGKEAKDLAMSEDLFSGAPGAMKPGKSKTIPKRPVPSALRKELHGRRAARRSLRQTRLAVEAAGDGSR